ncbi:MAG TPA: hypothetical protein PLF44_07725 [Candidatus Mcinerneyibacteriales bacterium]|nr:hypothetical protein [Candidatus Mcinerneyibacteriales bacterium]HPJ70754.1 hypothetical protein [Candidatus Mcinerneyibacteriales bacterium]HPQ90254.1 hypothetical protein [Candidatus Mcinerneyibacteriales bacterium]
MDKHDRLLLLHLLIPGALHWRYGEYAYGLMTFLTVLGGTWLMVKKFMSLLPRLLHVSPENAAGLLPPLLALAGIAVVINLILALSVYHITQKIKTEVT